MINMKHLTQSIIIIGAIILFSATLVRAAEHVVTVFVEPHYSCQAEGLDLYVETNMGVVLNGERVR